MSQGESSSIEGLALAFRGQETLLYPSEVSSDAQFLKERAAKLSFEIWGYHNPENHDNLPVGKPMVADGPRY